jgi:Flp pilus assembly protein TadG
MTRFARFSPRRFRDGEEGSMVVPFALWIPVFTMLIVSSIELGTVTIRHTVLERSLDMAVRDLRIGTGATSHDALKADICERATILPDCLNALQLEMIPLNMVAWTDPPATADCVDVSEDFTPQRSFVHGGGGAVMMLRACYKFRPVTPIASFNASVAKDENGYTGIVSTAAFVTEPS